MDEENWTMSDISAELLDVTFFTFDRWVSMGNSK